MNTKMAWQTNEDHGFLTNATDPSSQVSGSYVKNVAVRFEKQMGETDSPKGGLLLAQRSHNMHISFRLHADLLSENKRSRSATRSTDSSTVKYSESVTNLADSVQVKSSVLSVVRSAASTSYTSHDTLLTRPKSSEDRSKDSLGIRLVDISKSHSASDIHLASIDQANLASPVKCCIAALNRPTRIDVRVETDSADTDDVWEDVDDAEQQNGAKPRTPAECQYIRRKTPVVKLRKRSSPSFGKRPSSMIRKTMKDKLTLTEKNDKFSVLGDDVLPFNSSSSDAVKADTVETTSISASSSFSASQPNLPRNESPVFTARCLPGVKRDAVKRDAVFTSPKRLQVSPVRPALNVSPFASPPPLPSRGSTGSSRSSSSSLSTAKRYRPPPPIPDDETVISIHPQKNSLSPSAALRGRLLCPAVRRSAPDISPHSHVSMPRSNVTNSLCEVNPCAKLSAKDHLSAASHSDGCIDDAESSVATEYVDPSVLSFTSDSYVYDAVSSSRKSQVLRRPAIHITASDWFSKRPQRQMTDASLQDDDDDDDDDDADFLYENEPLYQIYHQSAIVRDVISQNAASGDEHESEYSSPCEYVEHARMCMNDILRRSMDRDGQTPVSRGVTAGLSTLEWATQSGASFKRFWCEMPKVKCSGLIESMSVDERRLQEAQFEVISSEVSYLKSMNILVGHFMANLGANFDRDRELTMSRDDFNRLFSNARAVRDASIKMMTALESLWHDSCLLNPSLLGQAIADVAQAHFGVYIIYCSNAIYQNRKLNELMQHNEEFRYMVSRLEAAAECQLLPLSSFLTLPMQRITRMPLLVSAVCQRLETTTGHSCPCEVTRCLSVLQKIVEQCNDGARKMSCLEQIMEIDRLINFKLTKKVPLVSKSRCLVKKGPLTQLCKPTSGLRKKYKRTLHFFLFNDLLIITKKKNFRDKPYEVVEHCPRMHVHAEPITDEDASRLLNSPIVASSCRNLFYLVLLENRVEFVLATDSVSERMRWIQAVTPLKSNENDDRIYEEWDCPQVQSVTRYEATEPDELLLEESDVINVFRKVSDGWYYGERIRDNEKGWFPANHTIEIQNAHVRARNLRHQFWVQRRESGMSSIGSTSTSRSPSDQSANAMKRPQTAPPSSNLQ